LYSSCFLGAQSVTDFGEALNEHGSCGISCAHLWNPFLRTLESVPHKIPWPMNSPSQEIHHERSWLDLDRGQEQHTSGQQEEAQT
jgi:hypothetical protein